jgi:hypothetical protein
MLQITTGEINDRRIGILYQIQRFSQEEAHGSLAVQHLEHEYNNTVQKIYHDTPGGFWDIIEVFPPEIWIHILQESLPMDHYAPALLLLTTISTKWQQAITSTPLLWAYIEISGFDEDSLARIHVFTHFSRGTPLLLTIHVPFYYDLGITNSIMARLGDRVHQVVITVDKRSINNLNQRDALFESYILQGINLLLKLRHYTANVVYMDLGCDDFCPSVHGQVAPQRYAGILSSQLRAIRGLCLCQMGPYISQIPLQHLAELTTCIPIPLEVLKPNFAHMHKIKRLHMTQINLMPSSKPILTSFSYKKLRVSLPTKLLDIVTPQLLELSIHVAEEQVTDIIPYLVMATKLRALSLTFNDQWSTRTSYIWRGNPQGKGISSLKKLEISFKTHHTRRQPGKFKVQHQLELLDAIRTLYQNVEDAVFYFGNADNLGYITLTRLSYLGNLKHLKLDGIGWFVPYAEREEFTFQRLTSLEIFASDLVGAIRAPQLLTLMLPWDDECEEEGTLDYSNVRTLHVKGSDNSSRRIDIPTDGMPSLTGLTLDVPGCDSIQLGLSLFLTEITIIGEPDTPIATSLCFTILYQSEECPSLCNIRLLGCAPEWDVLFTMLESRNFMTSSSVSRICRITLPRVPYELRGPLASLLRGLYTKRPKNEDLSFKGIIEMLFDKKM